MKAFSILLFSITALLFGGSSASLAQQESNLRYKQLEEEITAMKETVLKEKNALRELEEAVLFGKINSTYSYITFRNQAEGFFQIDSGEFFLNGQSIAKLSKEQLGKSSLETIQVLDAEIPVGENVLTLQLKFKGQKKGPFTYIEDYLVDVESKKNFRTEQGKTRAIEIVVYDRGTSKNEWKDRLAVTFNVTSGS